MNSTPRVTELWLCCVTAQCMVSSHFATQQAPDESWVWPLRAERQKEPRLNPPIPKKRQAPVVDKRTIQEDTQTLDEAISALKEALNEPPPPPQPKARPRKSRPPENKSSVAALQRQQTLEQPEKPRAPEFGETLLFWKEYDSKPYEQKGLPAWHEETPRGVTPLPATPRVAKPATPRPVPPPRSRDWGKEAAVQRRVVAREHADWPGNSHMSVDFEVQLRSKERLRHMLRTGQKERVKKELAASLPLVVEQDEERRPSVKLDSSLEDGQTKRLKNKAASEPKKRQGDAAEALRMMTFQRNELLKARRALEQVVDRRRESDKIMDKLKQVLAKYKKPKPAVDSAIADAIHEQFHLRERSAIDKV
eukprot:s402_g11.t1